MSREIKFRVWDKVAKAMHVCETNSHDTFFFDPHTCDFTYYNLQNGETSNGHSDYILEQYTGLKDKNGKEIYEGDIVKRLKSHEFLKNVEETEIFRIRWGVRKAGFFAYSKERKKHNIPAKRLNANDVYEVIGNIHENPELLEDK